MPGEILTLRGAGVDLAAERWPAEGPRDRGAILLLHGGGQTRHSWDRSAVRFARAGWTSVSYDARGHGDSGWSPEGDYSLDAIVDDLRAVVEQIGGPVVMVGASLGGLAAMVAEGEYGGLARAIVLVDIVATNDEEGAKRILAFMGAHLNGFASLEDVADAVSAYNPHRPRPRSLDGLRKNVRLRDDGRWYWHWDPAFLDFGDEATRRARPERLRAAASRIGVPVMLVRGAQSDVVDDAGVEDLRRLIPSARIVEALAGHMVAGDDNDVFVESVEGFLDEALGG